MVKVHTSGNNRHKRMRQPDRVEFQGERALLRRGGEMVQQLTIVEAVGQLTAHSERSLFPGASPIPDGVRFVRTQGDTMLVVIEAKPQCRQVRWLMEASAARFGPSATYRAARLAFPYIILFLLFHQEQMTGYQQLFYRVAPIASEADELFLPNLYNIAIWRELPCWLCLKKMENVSHLTLSEKITRVVDHLWTAAFNRSADTREGDSYWVRMQGLDPRIGNLEAWEKASAEDPAFVLRVPWKPAGLTVQQVIGTMLAMQGQPSQIKSGYDLISVLYQCGT